MTIIVFYVHMQATAGLFYSYLQTHKNEKWDHYKKENKSFFHSYFIYTNDLSVNCITAQFTFTDILHQICI